MTSDGTELDLSALRTYLLGHGMPPAGELTATAINGGRSNLTYRVTDGQTSWVLRRPPTGGLTPSAHDVGREYRIVAALQGSPVPVAPAVAYCADPSVLGWPFAVVGFIPGRVLRVQDDLTAVDDGDLGRIGAELIRVLVALHAVPFAERGLSDFGRPEGFFGRQVRRWRQQWDLVSIREQPDVDRLHAGLIERTPAVADASIVHGDYRIDNTLLDHGDPGHMLALVDWEMSTIGDPLTDVAMLCVYQHPAFDHVVGEPAASTSPRWPKPAQIAQAYAQHSGRDLADFDAYLALAHLKLAVIAEGIAARHRAGAGRGAGFETAGEAVPDLLADGLAVLRGAGS
jgi:aminoglycoside phosphotransferase (APT) family kinase protein